MSTQQAGRIGAFNTPDALLFVERLAIKQDEICELAPYSDYRNLVSLPRPQDFTDISKDPDVASFLKKQYKTPADVDFYIGLFAEDPEPNSPLPSLMLTMVAVDAFSQALTNPLLSRRVFCENTFSKVGWDTIHNTSSLHDIVKRNVPRPLGDTPITMTHVDWQWGQLQA